MLTHARATRGQRARPAREASASARGRACPPHPGNAATGGAVGGAKARAQPAAAGRACRVATACTSRAPRAAGRPACARASAYRGLAWLDWQQRAPTPAHSISSLLAADQPVGAVCVVLHHTGQPAPRRTTRHRVVHGTAKPRNHTYLCTITHLPCKHLRRLQVEALDLFDALLDDPALHFSMRLQPGDVQFVYVGPRTVHRAPCT